MNTVSVPTKENFRRVELIEMSSNSQNEKHLDRTAKFLSNVEEAAILGLEVGFIKDLLLGKATLEYDLSYTNDTVYDNFERNFIAESGIAKCEYLENPKALTQKERYDFLCSLIDKFNALVVKTRPYMYVGASVDYLANTKEATILGLEHDYIRDLIMDDATVEYELAFNNVIHYEYDGLQYIDGNGNVKEEYIDNEEAKRQKQSYVKECKFVDSFNEKLKLEKAKYKN